MKVLGLLVLCTALLCTHSHALKHKTVPIHGWSVAGRHASQVYSAIQQLRSEGYTHFAVPQPTHVLWYVRGEIIASKEPLKGVAWDGFKVARVVQ